MKLQASKAHLWAHLNGCTGHVGLYQKVREFDTTLTDEGRVAHELAAMCISNPAIPFSDIDPKFTKEMWDGAQLYSDVIYDDLSETMTLQVEKSIRCEAIHDDLKPIIDSFSYSDDTLYVYEYKFGRNPVEVHNNSQLMLGVIAVMKHLNIKPNKIEIIVVQPRAFHSDGPVRRASLTPDQLNEFFAIARTKAQEYHSNPTCRTGVHCNGCNAKLRCTARLESTLSCVDYVEAPREMEFEPMELGEHYKLLKRISKQIEKDLKSIEEELTYLTREGKHTGFTLAPSVLPLKWNLDTETITMMGDTLGVNLRKPVDVITPTQAKQLKLLTEEQVNDLATRPEGGLKLTLDNAKEVFK